MGMIGYLGANVYTARSLGVTKGDLANCGVCSGMINRAEPFRGSATRRSLRRGATFDLRSILEGDTGLALDIASYEVNGVIRFPLFQRDFFRFMYDAGLLLDDCRGLSGRKLLEYYQGNFILGIALKNGLS